MENCPQLYLNPKKARFFTGHHPWVLSHSVTEPTAPIEPGSVVELLMPSGQWIGRGIYNRASRIRIRLYQWDSEAELNTQWVLDRLASAVGMRQSYVRQRGRLDAVRLVNSEGDGLSGLIVDQFGPYLVVQVTALAITKWLDEIIDWLDETLSPAGIIVRIDEKTAANEGLTPQSEAKRGSLPDGVFEITDDGIRLGIDLTTSQKTGYYLDQRANRHRAARWITSGSMLDVCTYIGGFSLAACKWGTPEKIRAIDSSAAALEQAQRNAELNGFDKIEFVKADCFDYMEQLSRGEERFQTVVLDPPRMAGNRNQLPSALRAYHRLNFSAVNVLNPGGILVTCSCSGRVTRADFAGMLASVSKRTKRPIQILESYGADFDHPIDVNCPESEYLKFYICRVG